MTAAESVTVSITTSSFGASDERPLRLLEQGGIAYRLNPHGRRPTPTETMDLLEGAQGVIAGTEELSEAVLAAAPALRVISRVGVGIDNIDLSCAARRGIEIRTTSDAHVQAVAELTIALMLDVLRGISAADRQIRGGVWAKSLGRSLSGRVVGIVGLGRVGRRVVELLEPFGVSFIACDVTPDRPFAERHGVELGSLDEVVAAADILTLHIPSTESTRGLIDARRIGAMKDGAVLVNTARGGVVDEDALAAALRSGQLLGAASDVFGVEPYAGPLSDCDRAVLTPHIGSHTAESRVQMEIEAVQNLLGVLETEARR